VYPLREGQFAKINEQSGGRSPLVGVMYAARRPVYDLIENENCVPTHEASQPERQIKVEYSLFLKSAFELGRASHVL